MTAIVWFRQDLRLRDQPALAAAVASGGPVIPLFVFDEAGAEDRAAGGASRWWLHRSLAALDASLRAKGSRLILRRGRAADVIAAIANHTGASEVHACHHVEPWHRRDDADVAARMPLTLHHGLTLAPPGSVLSPVGKRYRLFTPWWKALLQDMPPPKPTGAPDAIAAPDHWPESDDLDDWALLPTRPDWAGGMRAAWTPGEDGAAQRLRDFLPHLLAYDHDRNFPAVESGVSRLSPHLHFGEISPSLIWHVCAREAGAVAQPFLREVAWRDFGMNMADQLPDFGWVDARPGMDAFPWRRPDTDGEAAADFDRWTAGKTGYPIIDAGMRELWATGWVHNRVRMLVASFLVKHLLIDWRAGERWFWDTLVDADYGNNALGWQWIAGTGFESNPFGRIMAPLGQSEKFDCGAYIRRWVPELRHIPDPAIHDPEEHGLKPAGYPPKIIGHQQARARALAAIAQTRSA